MILGTDKIKERLEAEQIFRRPSWDYANVKEASYALRVAKDGMVVDGNVYRPGTNYPEPIIQIKPGYVAILSTEERLCMPSDLVGKLGVRLDFASRGLTGLMGIQVDPYYGINSPEERLFIKVANFGNKTVEVKPGDAVFNIEFSQVEKAAKPDPPKRPTWDRLLEELVNQPHSHLTFVASVQQNVDIRTDELESKIGKDLNETSAHQQRELEGIRNNQQSVVMFGVFLVAITILSVSVMSILNVKDAPTWITHVGWIFLLIFCGIATTAIGVFIGFAGWAFWKSTRGAYQERNQLVAPPTRAGIDNTEP